MKLSIITINYNNAAGLEKTIHSVACQSSTDFEYIIVDGASTDGSVGIIQQNLKYITRWVSEKDNGIYHAMNKGVAMANGEYCLFLNSGDVLFNKSVIGNVQWDRLDCDIISGATKHSMGYVSQSPKNVTMKTFVLGSLGHQSTFIKRELLILTPYDERFKIGADWRFFIQVLIYQNVSYRRIPDIISCFDDSGISSTLSRSSERRLMEQEWCRDILPERIEADYGFSKFVAKWKWRF